MIVTPYYYTTRAHVRDKDAKNLAAAKLSYNFASVTSDNSFLFDLNVLIKFVSLPKCSLARAILPS